MSSKKKRKIEDTTSTTETEAPASKQRKVSETTTTTYEETSNNKVTVTNASTTSTIPRASAGATKRLLKEFERLQAMNKSEEGVEAEVNENNMYIWDVKLFNFPEDSDLAKDLKKHKEDCVRLQIQFPPTFPWDPPFIRVVRPRFQFRTGHVTVGGSICMELLTKSGWQPTNTIEAVLVQIRAEMIAGGARLDPFDQRPYTEAEAREAFVRVAASHGWEV